MANIAELERRLADLETQISPTSAHVIVDSRLTEKQKRHMRHMMDNLGLNEQEAKIRVLCMGNPPEHFEQIPAGGAYPKMLYNKNGKFCKVNDEEEHAEMTKEGWVDKPLKIHLEKLQNPGTARDEKISRLKKELDQELVAKATEKADVAGAA
jgi:uncharacterized coiled-coil protein SlyX